MKNPQMEIPGDLPSYYKPLSLRLCRVLDNIGVSEDIQKIRMEVATNREILSSVKSLFSSHPKITNHIFGSYSEGTTTSGCYFFDYNKRTLTNLGLFSDVDFLNSFEDFEVVQDITEAPADKTSFLLVTDEETKPGYVKLQLIKDGTPRTAESPIGTEFIYTPNAPRVDKHITYGDLANRDYSIPKCRLTYIEDEVSNHTRLLEDGNAHLTWKIDSSNRVVVVNRPAEGIQKDVRDKFDVHGPAVSSSAGFGWQAVDVVYAYKCQKWLRINENWLNRKRKFNWPSSQALKEMEMMGFFVVPVGHPHSGEQNNEWRISFSLQERRLMHDFSPTQFKCYVLMKFIKKEIIPHFIKEETLTSYHLKTCMFYMIENTPSYMWTPGNILACLEGCLKCLVKWAKDGDCPNYFIPDENMFEKRIHGPLQSTLVEVLEKLVSSKCGFLLQLQRDDIGKRLAEVCGEGAQAFGRTDYKAKAIGTMFLDECREIMDVRNGLLHRFKHFRVDICCSSLFHVISELRKLETVTEHTKEQTQKAIFLLLPYLEINLMANLIVQEQNKANCTENVKLYLLSKKWNEVSMNSDGFSAKLKQATLLHAFEYYHESLEILYALEKKASLETTILCACRDKVKMLSYKVVRLIQQNNLSIEDLRHKIWAPCSVFLSTEAKFVPVPLQYEMTRSNNSQYRAHLYKELKNEWIWYDSAVVDNKFYMYFLLYLNHYKLGKPSETAIDIDSMELLLGIDPCLRHLETDMNLLSWVYKQEGLKAKAVGGFKTSLALQGVHNAALRHLKEIEAENVNETPQNAELNQTPENAKKITETKQNLGITTETRENTEQSNEMQSHAKKSNKLKENAEKTIRESTEMTNDIPENAEMANETRETAGKANETHGN